MSIEALRKDIIDRLEIDPSEIYKTFQSLEGTRHIIQYQNPDYTFSMSKTFKPKVECFGITNRCQDGKFVLFLDYDKIYKEIVYKNLDNLLKKYPKNFGNFYIATTEPEEKLTGGQIKGSYHVINFSKHYKYQIEDYLNLCDVDPYFKEIPLKTAHKCHVLPFSKKYWKIDGQTQKQQPKFLEIHPGNRVISPKESSYAHYKFFKAHWGITDLANAKHQFDSLYKIELHKYSTPKVSNDG